MQQSHPPGTSCVKNSLLLCLTGPCRGCITLLDLKHEGLAVLWQRHGVEPFSRVKSFALWPGRCIRRWSRLLTLR